MFIWLRFKFRSLPWSKSSMVIITWSSLIPLVFHSIFYYRISLQIQETNFHQKKSLSLTQSLYLPRHPVSEEIIFFFQENKIKWDIWNIIYTVHRYSTNFNDKKNENKLWIVFYYTEKKHFLLVWNEKKNKNFNDGGQIFMLDMVHTIQFMCVCV